MSEKTPSPEANPYVTVRFPNITGALDWGDSFSEFEFKGMANGGYTVRATLFDSHFNLLTKLMGGTGTEDQQYLRNARNELPILMEFQIRWHNEKEINYPDKSTRTQHAYVVSLSADGAAADMGRLEFIAIDPPSWFLNTGDASGKMYKGRVSKVMEQMLDEYCPVKYEVSKTKDSDDNKFWMMRQDPKTFLSSLVDWSSSVTPNKTNWIIGMDGKPVDGGPQLIIKEQNELQSQQRAFYTVWHSKGHDSIGSWELLTDNALAITNTKLVTSGISATTGAYLDKIKDEKEDKLFAKDITTDKKKIAKTKSIQAFTKPDDDVGKGPDPNPDPKSPSSGVGWTSITSIPELYSAGDIGMKYEEYIDGRPRGMFLNLTNALMRAKITVIGHGIWDNTLGLGVDTVFLKWWGANNEPWFMSGNWLVYGFHHRVKRRTWETDVYIARYDQTQGPERPSKAVPVGGFVLPTLGETSNGAGSGN
jgi:hypothetical protein